MDDLIKDPECLLDVLSSLPVPLSLHHQAAELSARSNKHHIFISANFSELHYSRSTKDTH